MNELKLKIYPSFGNSYILIINLSDDVNDIEEFIETWIHDNLKNVESYKQI